MTANSALPKVGTVYSSVEAMQLDILERCARFEAGFVSSTKPDGTNFATYCCKRHHRCEYGVHVEVRKDGKMKVIRVVEKHCRSRKKLNLSFAKGWAVERANRLKVLRGQVGRAEQERLKRIREWKQIEQEEVCETEEMAPKVSKNCRPVFVLPQVSTSTNGSATVDPARPISSMNPDSLPPLPPLPPVPSRPSSDLSLYSLLKVFTRSQTQLAVTLIFLRSRGIFTLDELLSILIKGKKEFEQALIKLDLDPETRGIIVAMEKDLKRVCTVVEMDSR
ncbi:hypothetical protein JCM5350_003720 [Sporobolomyces pararoseus]